MEIKIPTTLEEWNAAGSEYLPGHMGLTFVKVEPDEVIATLAIRKAVRSWNGYLHAGTVATLADTCRGYGTVRGLPEGATGFTTIESQTSSSSPVRPVRAGTAARPIVCRARPSPHRPRRDRGCRGEARCRQVLSSR